MSRDENLITIDRPGRNSTGASSAAPTSGTPTERLLLGSLTFAMAEGRLAALGIFWNAERADFVGVTG